MYFANLEPGKETTCNDRFQWSTQNLRLVQLAARAHANKLLHDTAWYAMIRVLNLAKEVVTHVSICKKKQ